MSTGRIIRRSRKHGAVEAAVAALAGFAAATCSPDTRRPTRSARHARENPPGRELAVCVGQAHGPGWGSSFFLSSLPAEATVLASDSLPRDGLDELHAAQEPMQVFEQQDRGAGAL